MNYKYILENLSKSKFRNSFKLKQKDIDYLKEKGFIKIKEHAYDFISKRLAPSNILNDGKQTPMRGHPVFIAQHATATCCRGCLYKWHKIKMDKELNDKEITYIVNIIMLWINKQIKGGNMQEIKEYVKEKHKGQKRKQGTPYYEHPFTVAEILKEKGFNNDYYLTGLFHDLLEDTNATEDEILKLSNKEVLTAVKLLTKQKNYNIDDYINGINNHSIAKMVKLADRLHNLKEAIYADDTFKQKYIKETNDYYIKLAKDTIFEDEIKKALEELKNSV